MVIRSEARKVIRQWAIWFLVALALVTVEPIPHHETGLLEMRAKVNDELEWSEFHADAFAEYSDEFTRLFNATETKWAKNGRLMIRPEGAKSFKFAKQS